MTQLKASAAARAALNARTEAVDSVDPATQESWTGQGRPRAIPRLAEPTPEQREEAERGRARLAALKDVTEDYARTTGIDFVQACTALATGLIRDGKVLRALAPTAQLGKMASGRGRNPALLTPRNLSALAMYHDLHLARIVGSGSVDLERPRVQGGGAGDMLHALIRGADAGKAFAAAKESFCAPAVRRIVDWVVVEDRPIDDFGICREYIDMTRDYQRGARRVLLLQGAYDLVRHFRI